MKSAADCFISSAYWTENIGYAAAIATINYMKNNVSKTLRSKGKKLKMYGMSLQKYNLPIEVLGIDYFQHFHSKLLILTK